MLIMILNRKEEHRNEKNDGHFIVGISKAAEKKRVSIRSDYGVDYGWRNDIRCVYVSG